MEELNRIIECHDIARLKTWLDEHAKYTNPNDVLELEINVGHIIQIEPRPDERCLEFMRVFLDAKYAIPINFMDPHSNLLFNILHCMSCKQIKVIFATRAGIQFMRRYETHKSSAIITAISQVEYLSVHDFITIKTLLEHTRITKQSKGFSVKRKIVRDHLFSDHDLYEFAFEPVNTRKRRKMQRLAIQADLMDSALVFCFVVFVDRQWFKIN